MSLASGSGLHYICCYDMTKDISIAVKILSEQCKILPKEASLYLGLGHCRVMIGKGFSLFLVTVS